MKAIRVHELGGPEVLRLEEVTTPEPGPGQARVKVAAAGVNFIEVYQRKGQYKMALPYTPGSEGAGVVEALGPGTETLRVGDRVAWAQQPGSDAEYVIVDPARVVAVPEGIGLEQAAAVMLQGMTAHYLTHSTFPLRSGQTALIHAAGGGVGQLLVRIAKRLGARVIGTAGAEEKIQLARAAGADEVIAYRTVDFAHETRRLTDGQGVDVVYDSVGKETFEGSLNSLRPRGYLVLFGQSSGPVGPFDPQALNAKGSLFLTRPTLANYIATREELVWRSDELFRWMRDGSLTVRIDRAFPLAQAAAAHRYLEDRQTKGKVLLIP
jgi:NADPH:quinone reductase